VGRSGKSKYDLPTNKSQYEPIVLGITKASLETDGFCQQQVFKKLLILIKPHSLKSEIFTRAKRKCYFRSFITSRNRF
jgi:hypothetical protein